MHPIDLIKETLCCIPQRWEPLYLDDLQADIGYPTRHSLLFALNVCANEGWIVWLRGPFEAPTVGAALTPRGEAVADSYWNQAYGDGE